VALLGCALAFPQLLYPPLSAAQLQGVASADKRIELQQAQDKLQNDARATLLQGAAGVLLVFGAVATWWQLQISREGQLTERFSRAVEQLGSDNEDVRIGAIRTLERIAKDSPRDRNTVQAVIGAYVRKHAPWLVGTLKGPQHPTPVVDKHLSWLEHRRGDIQTAMWVLGARRPYRGEWQLYLSRVDLRGAFLYGRLSKAQLRHTNLAHALLPEVRLEHADLEDADLRKANLQRTWLTRANLRKAHLQGADLREADLREANLREAHLQGADLRGADLGEANLREAHLEDADLSRARVDPGRGAFLKGRVSSALPRHTNLAPKVRLEYADQEDADLRKAKWQRTRLTGANLRKAHLQGADLREADLREAKLHGANLRGAHLEDADLTKARADRTTTWPDAAWGEDCLRRKGIIEEGIHNSSAAGTT
jgi:uncharacterized protein YjbI with pentapeptide repeats